MKKKFLNFTISFIQRYQTFSELELEKLRYGLQGLYLTITKMIIILGVAIGLGILKEVIITLVLFNIIRYTGFGFHAEKSYQCLIISLINFIVIPLFFMQVPLSKYMGLGICFFCVLSYFLYAPADTKKRPLPNKKKRIIRKTLTVFIGIIYSILIYFFFDNFLTPLLLSALVVQAIIINPLLYRLFNQPYRNYQWYKNGLNTQSI